MAPRVTTLDGFAQFLNRASANDAWPDQVDKNAAERHLVGAEDAIEGRIPYELDVTAAEARTFDAAGESVLRLPGGVRNVTKIMVDGVEITSYRILSRRKRPGHLLIGLPWCSQIVEVTGDWGFETCPTDLVDAIYALAQRVYELRQSRQADISQSADGRATSYFDRLPTAASQVVANYALPSM